MPGSAIAVNAGMQIRGVEGVGILDCACALRVEGHSFADRTQVGKFV
jgi:hypothetical protein